MHYGLHCLAGGLRKLVRCFLYAAEHFTANLYPILFRCQITILAKANEFPIQGKGEGTVLVGKEIIKSTVILKLRLLAK